MEQTCYKCGAAVDEGRAFCPQCNAPQIRVAAMEPVAQPAAALEAAQDQAPARSASSSGRIDWSQALPAVALAAVISSVLMVVPLGAFGLGMLAAGGFSVLLYRRRDPATDVTPGMGARLGALGGLLGFGIFVVFMAVSALLLGGGDKMREAVKEAIAQAAARSGDPQTQQALEFFKTPAGMAFVIVAGMAVMLVLFVGLASLGGALGAVLLRRKERR